MRLVRYGTAAHEQPGLCNAHRRIRCLGGTGNTRTVIFFAATIVSDISPFMTLEAADIITTGTPPGVGMGRTPEPIYLSAGDTVRLGITRLGGQRQFVTARRNT